MALLVKRRIRVGNRFYHPGEVIEGGDEVELRSRPLFSALVRNGRVEEIDRQAPAPTLDAKDADEVKAKEDFACKLCDFVGKSQRSIDMHIRRAHPEV